ncbi:MAG: hypothetical protein PHY66_05905 [Aliarcobacter sp.]|nr:hypothetical protein [Aliarcobacter sp.]
MTEEEYWEFVECQRINELTRDFAELNVIIKDKNIVIITCNIEYQKKRLYTNILVVVDKQLICSKIQDFKLFIKELKYFNINEERKFVELKSRKTDKGIEHNLNIKKTDIYINKAEADTIVNMAEYIDRAYKYASVEDIKKCEDPEYFMDLLVRSEIIERK